MWFRRSIAFAAGSAILAGLVAAIVEAKKNFDALEKEKAEEAEEAETTEEETPEEVTEELELTPDEETVEEQSEE